MAEPITPHPSTDFCGHSFILGVQSCSSPTNSSQTEEEELLLILSSSLLLSQPSLTGSQNISLAPSHLGLFPCRSAKGEENSAADPPRQSDGSPGCLWWFCKCFTVLAAKSNLTLPGTAIQTLPPQLCTGWKVRDSSCCSELSKFTAQMNVLGGDWGFLTALHEGGSSSGSWDLG